MGAPSPRRAEPKVVLSVRIRKTLYDRAHAHTQSTAPYTPSLSEIIDRGLELAVAELDAKAAPTS